MADPGALLWLRQNFYIGVGCCPRVFIGSLLAFLAENYVSSWLRENRGGAADVISCVRSRNSSLCPEFQVDHGRNACEHFMFRNFFSPLCPRFTTDRTRIVCTYIYACISLLHVAFIFLRKFRVSLAYRSVEVFEAELE